MGHDVPVPEKLGRFFDENPRVALAFSGGADSSYLFYAARMCKADVRAYFVKTAFQTQSEMADAIRTARELDGDLCVIDRDILSDPAVASNPPDRCYWCKRRIFGTIASVAGEDGRDLVIDATNASDDPAVRPGMRALAEMGVRSPLKECQITKREVRELSRRAGLWTWNLPSNSCLATRIPAGTALTAENLRRTEEAELMAAGLGLSDLRIRTAAGGAFVEVRREQEELLGKVKPELERILLEHYGAVAGYGTREVKE